ncbi:MAG: hypothetical protein ACRDWE_09710 [Acidimicrobiales bacterium]
MDADVDEGGADSRADMSEWFTNVQVRTPEFTGLSELRGTQELPVVLARERAEKVGMHGGIPRDHENGRGMRARANGAERFGQTGGKGSTG